MPCKQKAYVYVSTSPCLQAYHAHVYMSALKALFWAICGTPATRHCNAVTRFLMSELGDAAHKSRRRELVSTDAKHNRNSQAEEPPRISAHQPCTPPISFAIASSGR